MRTNDFVSMLANGAGAVEPGLAARRFATAIGWGVLGALCLMLVTLEFRADLTAALREPKFWMKIGFVVSLAAAALGVAWALSRPGIRLGVLPVALVLPVAAIWSIAALTLIDAAPERRLDLLLGRTWMVCPFLIALLSAPVLVAALAAMKALAPTRPALSGAAAGLLAGAVGSLVYCLHCPEMEAPFLGVWYVLGMLIPTAIGAVGGRACLRW